MDKPPPRPLPTSPRKSVMRYLRVPHVVLRLLAAPFLFTILGLLLLDMFVPGSPERAVLRDIQEAEKSTIQVLGHTYSLYRSIVTTDDFREMVAELIVPRGEITSDLPLIIVNSAFMRGNDVLAIMGSSGNNAMLVYTPPDLYNMRYNVSAATPDSSFLRTFWEGLRLNPINRWINIYIGLNRAPSDIVRLVDWARDTTKIDIKRINVIGLGLGCLTATQAALALEKIGLPPRTLTLVFPPADLQAAIEATVGGYWIGSAFGAFNEFMLRRMLLPQTLPLITSPQKLLIVPVRDFDIPTYAVEPAIHLSRSGKTTFRINMEYKGWSLPQYTRAIRDQIFDWLIARDAIRE